MGQNNLTIRRLPEHIKDIEFQEKIQNLIDKAIEVTSFARDWRNRRIAHRDLELKLEPNIKPLKSANRLKITRAISAICNVINELSLHYFDSSNHFEPIEQPGGVRELLIHLNRSALSEEKRQKRIEGGQFLPEDLHDEALSIDLVLPV